MSEQPEQPVVMTDAEVAAAQIPAPTTAHVCQGVGYCQVCGATTATTLANVS